MAKPTAWLRLLAKIRQEAFLKIYFA